MEERLQVRCCKTPGHPLAPRDPRDSSFPLQVQFAELNPGFPLLAIPGTAVLRLNLELCAGQGARSGLGSPGLQHQAPTLLQAPPGHRQGLLEPLRQSWASPRAPAWGYLGQYSSSPPTSWIGSGTRFVPGHIRDVPLRLPR